MECQSSNDNALIFTWRIENFSHCLERRGEHLASPVFDIKSIKDSQCEVTPSASSCLTCHWRVLVYPRGQVKENIAKDFSLCLVYISSGNVTASYNLEVIDSDGLAILSKSEEAVEFMTDDQCHSLQPSLSDIDDIWQTVSSSQDTLIVRCSVWNIQGNIANKMQCSALTRMGVNRMTELWRIPGFSNLGVDLPRSADLLMIFPSTQPVVRLRAFLHGESVYEARLQIEVLYNCDRRSLMSCKISVLDRYNREVEMLQDKFWFSRNLQQTTWTLPLFIARKYLLERKTDLLPSDVLSLRCDIELSFGVAYDEMEEIRFGLSALPDLMNDTWYVPQVCPRASNLRISGFLRGDMESLLHDKTLSDIQLKTGESIFSVHKAILSARSPVFKSLLAGDHQRIEIVPEMEALTMSRMLLYIYSDTIEDYDMEVEDFSKLYCAANKYGIISLKEKCSFALESKLSVENLPMVLSLADTHHDRVLTSTAQDFILSCEEEVMRSAEWMQFEVNDADLAGKTMYQLHRKKYEVYKKKYDVYQRMLQ